MVEWTYYLHLVECENLSVFIAIPEATTENSRKCSYKAYRKVKLVFFKTFIYPNSTKERTEKQQTEEANKKQ